MLKYKSISSIVLNGSTSLILPWSIQYILALAILSAVAFSSSTYDSTFLPPNNVKSSNLDLSFFA